MPSETDSGARALSSPERLAAVARTGLLDTQPEELFDRVIRLAARLLHAPAGALSIVTPERQFLKSEVGFPERWRQGRSMPLAYSFCQHVVTSGEPLIIRDAREDARVRHSPAVKEDQSIAYLGVPVEVGERIVGAFCVVDREPRDWTGEEVELLQELAATLVTAISYGIARRAAAESRAGERRLAIQNAAARILARAPTLEAAAAELLRTLCENSGWHTGVFWQVEWDAGLLVCAQAWSCAGAETPFARMSRQLVFLPGMGLPGRVWRTGQPEWVPNLERQPDAPRAAAVADAGLRSAFAFPLLSEGQVIGVLEFAADDASAPGDEVVETMSTLAAQIEPFVTRRRAEAENRRLAAIVESSADAIVATTPEGIITSWNRGARQLFGYSEQEALGRPVRFLVPPERIQDLHWIRSEVTHGELVQGYETERLHRDGRRVWISLSVTPIVDPEGGLTGLASIARDITEQRRTQDRLRQSEAEMRAILSALPDAVFVFGGDGRYLRVAPNAPHLLLAPAEQMLGRTLHEVLPADDADRFLAIIQHVLASGEKMTFEYGLRIGGRDVMFEATVSAMDSETVIWAARDVTARVQAERQARERQAQLAQAQKLDAIGRLAGGVAHDFNNLLTVVRGTVQLLLMDLPPGHPMAEDLRTIDEAGATAAALTAQLLTFSRKQPTRPAVHDLNAVAAGMNPLLRRLIGEQIEVALRLAPGPVQTRADRSQLEQVILNLAVNARDAMPDGGRLLIETGHATLPGSERRLPAEGKPGEPVVMLAVTDTGTGMTPEVLAHVFEPFFTTKAAGEGTGLGLATVYDIVRQGGGWVQVQSEPGRGTCFRIFLPQAQQASPGAPAQGDAEAAGRRGARVLVVEDEKNVREILRRCLERAGHQVLEAPTGGDALRLLRRDGALDLVVTDGVLPDMRGTEIVREVRASLPHVPVLIVSGYSERPLGGVPPGTPFLQKPFAPRQLLKTVNELLAAAVVDDDGAGSRGRANAHPVTEHGNA